MSSFSITAPETEIVLRPTGVRRDEFATGTTTYVVTNRGGQTVRTGLNFEIETKDLGTDVKWFSVKGEPDRDIGPGMSETFTVEVRVPGTSARFVTSEDQRRQHSFRAIAVNRKLGDNDFEVGSAIKFHEPVLVKSEVKWRNWAIAAAALVVVVGGVIWALWDRGDEVDVQNWVNLTLEDATDKIEKLGLEVTTDDPVRGPDFDKEKYYLRVVTGQLPEFSEGTPAAKIRTGDEVKLSWKWELKKTVVPPLTGLDLYEAYDALTNADLQLGLPKYPPDARPSPPWKEVVLSWHPTGEQPALTQVILTMTWKAEVRPMPPDRIRLIQQLKANPPAIVNPASQLVVQ